MEELRIECARLARSLVECHSLMGRPVSSFNVERAGQEYVVSIRHRRSTVRSRTRKGK